MRVSRSAIVLFFCWLMSTHGFAQDSLRKFSFSTYIEAYYSYDLNRPEDKLKPPFFYSFNKHNQPNVNIAMVKGTYQGDRFRANLGLMAGTYSQYNLAQEPELLRYLYEVNAGVRLGEGIWLDAGLLPSHLGMESAIGKDCMSLTRSIMADNSPYFETGGRLSYTTAKWYFAILILNGWQRIKPVEGNSLPSFGHQLQYKPKEGILLNSSSFIGTDKPDSARKMRYYHDLYGQFRVSDKVDLQFAFDIGAEQKTKGSDSYNIWATAAGGFRYRFSDMIAAASLVEYYADRQGVVTTTDTGKPLETFGFSETVDLHLKKWLTWRMEWRWLAGKDNIYLKEGVPQKTNSALTTSLAFALN